MQFTLLYLNLGLSNLPKYISMLKFLLHCEMQQENISLPVVTLHYCIQSLYTVHLLPSETTNCSEYSSKNRNSVFGQSEINGRFLLPSFRIWNTLSTSTCSCLEYLQYRQWLYSSNRGHLYRSHPWRDEHPAYTFFKGSNAKHLMVCTLGILYRNSCWPDSDKQTTSLPHQAEASSH